MRRGTTPTHIFNTDIDLTSAEVVYLTYKQGGEIVLDREIDSMEKRQQFAQFGRQIINKQTDSLLAGFGHDNSNGTQGASAVGLWSSITSTTATTTAVT